MRAATILLNSLHLERIQPYEELRDRLRTEILEADFLFVPALDLLFCLGLVEYQAKTDAFEYIGAP